MADGLTGRASWLPAVVKSGSRNATFVFGDLMLHEACSVHEAVVTRLDWSVCMCYYLFVIVVNVNIDVIVAVDCSNAIAVYVLRSNCVHAEVCLSKLTVVQSLFCSK